MTKCAFIALLGAPNAGKSTLINALVGSKVSIVTPKVQTTRAKILGLTEIEETQLIFVDTPGIFKPKKRLHRAMVEAAWRGAYEADFVALLVDVSRERKEENQAILEKIKDLKQPKILILNKIDLVSKENLLPLAQKYAASDSFEAVFMISALQSDGLEELKEYFVKNAPEGPWHFPKGQLSNLTDRLFAAEITREKLFMKLHDELPYALTIETEEWEEFENGSLKIRQVITVEREQHKAIIIGHKGSKLKEIGKAAREELAQIYGCPVHLFLFVRVREHWQDDPSHYQAMGLDYSE